MQPRRGLADSKYSEQPGIRRVSKRFASPLIKLRENRLRVTHKLRTTAWSTASLRFRVALRGVSLCCAPLRLPLRMPRRKQARQVVPRIEADPSDALLESGFRHLYELDFQGARADFIAYQKAAPNDPMGKTAEAASYLYEQFNAKGVFTLGIFSERRHVSRRRGRQTFAESESTFP